MNTINIDLSEAETVRLFQGKPTEDMPVPALEIGKDDLFKALFLIFSQYKPHVGLECNQWRNKHITDIWDKSPISGVVIDLTH